MKNGFVTGIKKYCNNFLQDLIYDVAFSPSPSPKIVQLILSYNNITLIEMLETHAARQKQPATLLLIIQEKIKKQQDISNCENLFIEMMHINNYNVQAIQVFLNLIKKDYDYPIKKLFELEHYSAISKYIALIAANNTSALQKIIPVFIEKYHHYDYIYYEVARNVIAYDLKSAQDLLNISSRRLRDFEKSILKYSIGYINPCNPNIIKNYCTYLISRNVHLFFAFERDILFRATARQLVYYATAVTFSSKRLILRRLVEIKDERCLIDFISHVPEYKNLLPML